MYEGHDFFGPLKWNCILVVALDEPVDGFAELLGRGEAGAPQGGADQNAEPAFDHIEPAGVGWSEVKVDLGMAQQPGIVLGLECAEVVEHHVISRPG